MRKILFLTFAAVCLIATGCSKNDGTDEDGQITMPKQSEKTQQAYADQETSGGFTFTAKSSWIANVTQNGSNVSASAAAPHSAGTLSKAASATGRGYASKPSDRRRLFSEKNQQDGQTQEVSPLTRSSSRSAASKASTRFSSTTATRASLTAATYPAPLSRAGGLPWLRLLLNGTESYSGGAGSFTLTIDLDPNYTGETRSATITITCGNDTITITVTQEGKTQTGVVPENPTPVTGVTLNKQTLELAVGADETLTATVVPANTAVKTVSWSSSAPAVASVDIATGKITAIASGVAVITAASTANPSITASCNVTVTGGDPVSGKKLLSKITSAGDYIENGEKVGYWSDEVIFAYDGQDRVLSIVSNYKEVYHDYVFEEPNKNSYVYDGNTVTCTYDLGKGVGEDTYTESATVTLGTDGYILSGTATEKQISEMPAQEYEEEQDIYLLTRTYQHTLTPTYSNGYLQKKVDLVVFAEQSTSPGFVGSNGNYKEVFDLTWSGGNLTKVANSGTGRYVGNEDIWGPHASTAVYGTGINKANIDMNWVAYSSEWISALDGYGFIAFGLYGKRSANLVESESAENSYGNTMANGQPYPPYKYTHTWQYDADGYPTSLTTKQLGRQIIGSGEEGGYVTYTEEGWEETYYFFYTGEN